MMTPGGDKGSQKAIKGTVVPKIIGSPKFGKIVLNLLI